MFFLSETLHFFQTTTSFDHRGAYDIETTEEELAETLAKNQTVVGRDHGYFMMTKRIRYGKNE